jgi:hypothetical protein
LKRTHEIIHFAKQEEFKKIPGSPIAYWVSNDIRSLYEKNPLLSSVAEVKQGLATADNNKFLRRWFEVSQSRIGFHGVDLNRECYYKKKWFPYNKGGEYRKWYGNQEYLVNWEFNGKEIRSFGSNESGRVRSRAQNTDYYFQPSVSWSFISSANFGARYYQAGFIFDVAGSSAFPKIQISHNELCAFLCSLVAPAIMEATNPTLAFQVGNIEQLPYIKTEGIENNASECIEIAKNDWNLSELSWGFTTFPLIEFSESSKYLSSAWINYSDYLHSSFRRIKDNEEENNRIFIATYGLQDELSPEVPENQITLARADREKDCQHLISYSIGCMMGRYSLDEPGLIYAHAGNVGFEPSRYATFPADADGIVPITDQHWFADDACGRIREFLRAVWGPDTLEENLA